MAKIRVHEFAKKLNIKSADVLSVLKSTEYEVTNVQSAIGEDAQAYVRAHIDQVKKGSDSEQKPQGKPKSDSNGIIGVSKAQQAARPRNIISISGAKKPKPERTAEEKAEGNSENNNDAESTSSRRDRNRRRRRGDGSNASNPQESGNTNGSGSENGRKKSGISTLYNAEYSTSTRRNNRDNRNGRRDNNSRPEQHSIIRPRPIGERAMRPISERTANREEETEEKLTAPVTPVQGQASREAQSNQVPKAQEAMQAGGSGADAAENRSAAQAQNAQTGNTSGTIQSSAGHASDSSAQVNPSDAAPAKDTASKADTAAKAGAADAQKNVSSAQTDTAKSASSTQADAAGNASSTQTDAKNTPAAQADTAKNTPAQADAAKDTPAQSDAQPGEQILQSGSRILGNIFADGNYTVQDTNDKSSGRSRSKRNRGDRDKRGENRDNNGRGENRDGRNENRDGNRNGRNDNRDGSRGDGRGSRDGGRGDGQGNRDGRNGNRGDRNAQNGERRNGGQGGQGDYRNDRGGQSGDRRNDRRGDRNAQNGDRRNGGQGGDYRNGGVQNGDRRNDRRGDRNAQGDRRGGGQGGDYRNDRSAQGGDFRNDRGSQSGDRRGGRAGGRDRFDRDAYDKSAGAEEQVRGKESRERAAVDRKNNNRHNNNNNNHDKLGSKRQENYVNLERHGGRKKPQAAPQQAAKEAEDTIRTITIPEKITIRDLADAMKLQPSVIIKELFLKGQMVTVNSEVTFEEAEEIALEHNVICEQEEKVDVIAEYYKEEEEPEESLVTRPPVVCVMGHVDHGKTSLLDAIRSTRVTDREAGGITQHIGASVVSINGQNITFLDTPGHEAFTAMRMRGANSTDIAILVIAADDGVMPQTVEAINHAKAANVEIMVAINKIDKEGANPERVKQELTEYELVPEEWGGSTVFCEVSAKTGEGIDNLLEMVLLTAEVLELKANPNRKARGLVIEAQLDKGRGSVATMLVQKGTLHVGDTIVCGSAYGRIRAMMDDQGRRVKEAGPSMPVEILGLNSVPNAGEMFMVPEEEHMAKEIALAYIAEEKNRLIAETRARMSLDDLFSQIQSGNMKELDLIVKADVQGSVEAVKQSLEKLSNEEVVVKVIHGGVGAINESDVILASASNAIIIGFNVKPDPMAKQTAEREKVDVRLYSVIYNAIDDVEAAMKGMLDPIFEERVLGHAEIRMIFKASQVGNIAGSYVLDGTIERGCMVRVSREGKQIFEGELESLKRFKDDVKEVRAGYECGLVIHGFNDIQELDIVEAYKMVEVPR